MARAPDVIVDRSPLELPTIDVPLRVGWLLRTCRLNSRVEPGLSGHRFAASVGVGPAMVTKWEKGSDAIDAGGIAGYERLVDLPAGTLRGLVETTRRYFRHPVGSRLGEVSPPEDLAELSEVVRPSMLGTPRGVDWFHLVDALADGGPLRLPEFVIEPVVDRLTDELSRAVGGAFHTRYAAMARLRTGSYSEVVLRSLLRHALAPDTQAPAAALNVAAQLPSGELFLQMTELLEDPRESVFHGAAQALVTMAALGGIDKGELRDAVPQLAHAYNAVSVDPRRHRHASGMLRNLPRGVLETARPSLVRPLAPVLEMQHWCGPRVSPVATSVADAVKRELPFPDDLVLERILHEALFDPRWPKAYLATHFLSVLPYTDVVASAVAHVAEHHDAAEVRQSAALLVLRLGQPATRELVEGWTDHDDFRLQRAALVMLGQSAVDVDQALLEKLAVDHWDVARLSLYAAGMTSSPMLREWAEDPAKPTSVRDGARWWIRHGGRITD